MAIRIITDSTADVQAGIKEALTTVPLTVHFGQQEYVDGVSITHREFYEKLETFHTLPSTSQATPAAFEDVFRQVANAGDSAVVLTLSSQLSGTWQSAMIAAEDYDNIYVVDTGSATIGAGILAQLALELVQKGLSASQIAQTLEVEKDRVCIIALLDTLEYLKRGGRISATAAFAGGLLNIKPVISLSGGQLSILGKVRGRKQGNSLLLAEAEKAGGIDFSMPVLLGYTGVSHENLQDFIAQSQPLWA